VRGLTVSYDTGPVVLDDVDLDLFPTGPRRGVRPEGLA
jgi:hypothetical protein